MWCKHLDQQEINPTDTSPLSSSRQSTPRCPIPVIESLTPLGWSAQTGTARKPKVLDIPSLVFSPVLGPILGKNCFKNYVYRFGPPFRLIKKTLLSSYGNFPGFGFDTAGSIYVFFFLKGKNCQKTHYMIKCFPLHFAPRLCPMERAKRGNEWGSPDREEEPEERNNKKKKRELSKRKNKRGSTEARHGTKWAAFSYQTFSVSCITRLCCFFCCAAPEGRRGKEITERIKRNSKGKKKKGKHGGTSSYHTYFVACLTLLCCLLLVCCSQPQNHTATAPHRAFLLTGIFCGLWLCRACLSMQFLLTGRQTNALHGKLNLSWPAMGEEAETDR